MRAEYGGMGLSLSEFGRVSEELGRSPLGHFVFNCQAPDSGNMEILAEFGTEQQRETFLLPLVAGDIRSCFSMTEPDLPGSNPTWMATTAVKEGQHYIIDGHKWFTSAADGAAFAIVMVVTNPQAEKRHDKASMIIVPTDTPGFNLVRNISVMGKQGDDYPTHCEIRYEECVVPAENLLGEEGAGFAIAQERLGPGRIHHCMRWIGICERAFSLMVARAATREVAPGKTLGMQGTIQDWIAESRAEINASRLLVLDAAARIDRQGVRKARVEVSIIKFYVAGVLQRVLDRAIQVHGALGMTDDTPLAFWYAHERAARIYDGPDEVHKMVVAREMLKAYQHEVSSARL
jgi:alkylation response protein AidB-like acyl-CoA dehydrogenase